MKRSLYLQPFILICLLVVIFLAGCSTVAPTPFPTVIATAVAELTSENIVVTTDIDPETASEAAAPTATPSAAASKADATVEETVAAETRTPSPVPSQTATPSITPTYRPQVAPTLSEVDAPTEFLEGVPTPSTAVPSPVPTFETPKEITNILLLGSDQPLSAEAESRTDTMIIVSINNEEQTASMISLPRDIYVYHPGKIMGRLNTATRLGGIEQLEQTILYNFGIPIHYYAQIDFDGFKDGVDAIGGVDIAVSCRLQDWRLISPDLDPEDEDNWAQFSLEPGVHHMDGDLALWYARSRLTTNDFDRGRRQQQLLHGMLNQGVDLNLIAEAPALWNTYKDTVNTDLDIGRLLQFATLASGVRANGIQHLYLAKGTQPWVTPSGGQVQLPLWEGEGNFGETFSRLYRTPTLSRASRPAITVEIVNASGNPDMGLLATDNLAWYGFLPVSVTDAAETEATTHVEYFHDNFKDSYDWLISWITGTRRANIEVVPGSEFTPDYRVVLGEDYNPCLNMLFQPQELLQ